MADLHVYKAINSVTKELATKGIAKNRKNTQQNYAFRGIDDVYNALAVSLADNELCIIPRMIERTLDERTSKNNAALFYVTVTAEFDFVSSVDGSKITARTYGEAMDSADKATNKAMSAAYKYVCLQTFCIPTEGDNDADATTPDVAPKTQAAPPPPPPKPKTVDPAAAARAKEIEAKIEAMRADGSWKNVKISFGKLKDQPFGNCDLQDRKYYHGNFAKQRAEGKKINPGDQEFYMAVQAWHRAFEGAHADALAATSAGKTSDAPAPYATSENPG